MLKTFLSLAILLSPMAALPASFLKSEFIFPLEHWHNHASSIVEAPNGDLMVCWFHGSGERKADDVKILGARKRKGEMKWSAPFEMADTPNYPDTNCTLFVDSKGRLWLFWPTILANEWETALMKYKIASKYDKDGPPQWELSEVLHITPGEEFVKSVDEFCARMEKTLLGSVAEKYLTHLKTKAADKLSRRLGWMTRAHPVLIDQNRLIVPLYSDGFSFSLMAYTDDWGKSWKTSAPLVAGGNIQPSVVQRKDGSLYALMRDNGLPPKRLHQSESRDRGVTWTEVTDSIHPNPGAGAEVIALKNGKWLLINNDLAEGRYRLQLSLSDDEGKTWQWKRYLEKDEPGKEANAFHYPSIMQSRDGTLHATYSYFINKKEVAVDAEGKPAAKTIKHAHFNEEWVLEGEKNL